MSAGTSAGAGAQGRLATLATLGSRHSVGGWRSARYARHPRLAPFRWRMEVGSLRSPPLAHAVPLSSRWRDLRRTLRARLRGLSRRRRGRPLVRAFVAACARCPRAFARPLARVRCPSPVACAPSAPAWGADAPRLVRRWGLVAPRFLFSGYAIPLAATLRRLLRFHYRRFWSLFGLVLAAARFHPPLVFSVVPCRASLFVWRRLVLAACRVQWPTLRPFARGPGSPRSPRLGPRLPSLVGLLPNGRPLRYAPGFGHSGCGVPPPFFVGYARAAGTAARLQLEPACGMAGTGRGKLRERVRHSGTQGTRRRAHDGRGAQGMGMGRVVTAGAGGKPPCKCSATATPPLRSCRVARRLDRPCFLVTTQPIPTPSSAP